MTAKTPAERQADRRALLLMNGVTEVRGIFLHHSQHAALKKHAASLAQKRPAPMKSKP